MGCLLLKAGAPFFWPNCTCCGTCSGACCGACWSCKNSNSSDVVGGDGGGVVVRAVVVGECDGSSQLELGRSGGVVVAEEGRFGGLVFVFLFCPCACPITPFRFALPGGMEG